MARRACRITRRPSEWNFAQLSADIDAIWRAHKKLNEQMNEDHNSNLKLTAQDIKIEFKFDDETEEVAIITSYDSDDLPEDTLYVEDIIGEISDDNDENS